MGPKTIIATGAHTVPNILIIRTKWLSTIHKLPADVRMGAMCCNINKSHMIFCRHVDQKYCYEAKTN